MLRGKLARTKSLREIRGNWTRYLENFSASISVVKILSKRRELLRFMSEGEGSRKISKKNSRKKNC